MWNGVQTVLGIGVCVMGKEYTGRLFGEDEGGMTPEERRRLRRLESRGRGIARWLRDRARAERADNQRWFECFGGRGPGPGGGWYHPVQLPPWLVTESGVRYEMREDSRRGGSGGVQYAPWEDEGVGDGR